MKTFWKALGIAALAAAVPVRIRKDGENGKKTYQSLLLSVDVGPGENGEGTDIGINFGEGVITGAVTKLMDAQKEAELFADDEPEAAVLNADEQQIITGETQPAAGEAQGAADGTDLPAGEIRDAAKAARDIVEEAAEASYYFDPEL